MVDRDFGINAQYTFSISDNINFNASAISGALSLTNPALDHEVVSNRSLPVLMIACDMGTDPGMMCCNQTINVTLRVRVVTRDHCYINAVLHHRTETIMCHNLRVTR